MPGPLRRAHGDHPRAVPGYRWSLLIQLLPPPCIFINKQGLPLMTFGLMLLVLGSLAFKAYKCYSQRYVWEILNI